VPNPLIVALDYDDRGEALAMARRLSPRRCRLKVGKGLFTRCGPVLVEELQALGFEIFLDLKFHDIPNTVAAAVRAAAELGVWMLNVHASGGRRMMEAAAAAVAGARQRPIVLGVTVLTSLSDSDLQEVGFNLDAAGQVRLLARLAAESGLDGVVCSAREAALLRREHGSAMTLVTPGIRLADAAGDDQRRVVSPLEAVAAGADHLVIGRAVTAAPDPLAVLEQIDHSLRDTPSDQI